MGQIFSNIIGTCVCGSSDDEKNNTEDIPARMFQRVLHIEEATNNNRLNIIQVQKESEDINDKIKRVDKLSSNVMKLEAKTDTAMYRNTAKINRIEDKIGNKLNLMDAKIDRLEQKIDNKFDMILLSLNQLRT